MSFRSMLPNHRRRSVRNLLSSRRRDGGAAPAGARSTSVQSLERRVLMAVDSLAPVADSFVRDPSSDQANFGASDFLYVKRAGSGDSRIAYLKFDVSNWSASDIGNSTLYLAGALQTPTTTPITASVYPVADSGWVEGNGNIAVRSLGGGADDGSQLTSSAIGDGYDTDNDPANEIDWPTGRPSSAPRWPAPL